MYLKQLNNDTMEKNEINKVKENFEEASKKYYECVEIKRKIREVSMETIKAVLSKADGNYVEIDEDNMMSVPYDGGNHPEYASNCYSLLKYVYLKDGRIFLEIEDCDEYEIDRINDDDVFAIAEVLVAQEL